MTEDQGQGLSRRLAEHVAGVRFEDLGAGAVDNAKRATLDTIGAMLAGTSVPAVGAVIELAAGWGGKAEARVVGQDLRLPAPLAAWCNGVLARVLDCGTGAVRFLAPGATRNHKLSQGRRGRCNRSG